MTQRQNIGTLYGRATHDTRLSASVWVPIMAAAFLAQSGMPARADVTYSATGTPAGLSATATAVFSISGGNLNISLSASGGGAGNYGPGSGLSGLFFDISSAPTLTPNSASVASGSSIVNASSCSPGPCSGVTNLDGEWGYQYSAGGFAGGPSAAYGIASSGYLNTGLAGDIGNFNGGSAGTNLDGPASLDGPNFEILPTGVSFSGGLSSTPIVENAVDFSLSGLPGNFVFADISNVSFQYGTSFSETNLTGTPTGTSGGSQGATVPEPASVALLAVGLLGLALVRARPRRQ